MESIHSLFPKIFPALDMAVFERRKKGSFSVVADIPEWYLRLHPDVQHRQDDHVLGLVFPFLGNFIIDADRLWQAHEDRKLRSGPWVETDEQGNQYFLEATAISLRNHRLLFVESLGSEFAERQALMQTARENSLEHQKTVQQLADLNQHLVGILQSIGRPAGKLSTHLALLEKESLSPSGLDFLTICRDQVELIEQSIQRVLDQVSTSEPEE